MGFILRTLIAALGLWLATEWVTGISVTSPTTLILAALLLGIVNAIIKPIAVLLTLVDTGVAMLHGVNERVAKTYEERQRPMPRVLRPALAVAIMAVSVYAAAAVGLVGLIAKGYGALTYAFIALVILPVLTVGFVRIRQLSPRPAA